VGLPNEVQEETEQAQGLVRNRFECPSTNRKERPSACLAESGQTAASTNQRGKATGSCSSTETYCGLDEEDANLSLVTSGALIGSCPGQEVVQEEAALGEIPAGWIRVKLEPDC
jgi:hypothetical protein